MILASRPRGGEFLWKQKRFVIDCERKFHHSAAAQRMDFPSLRNWKFHFLLLRVSENSYLLFKVHCSSSVLQRPSSYGSVHSAGDKLSRLVTFFNSSCRKIPKVDCITAQTIKSVTVLRCISLNLLRIRFKSLLHRNTNDLYVFTDSQRMSRIICAYLHAQTLNEKQIGGEKRRPPTLESRARLLFTNFLLHLFN